MFILLFKGYLKSNYIQLNELHLKEESTIQIYIIYIVIQAEEVEEDAGAVMEEGASILQKDKEGALESEEAVCLDNEETSLPATLTNGEAKENENDGTCRENEEPNQGVDIQEEAGEGVGADNGEIV